MPWLPRKVRDLTVIRGILRFRIGTSVWVKVVKWPDMGNWKCERRFSSSFLRIICKCTYPQKALYERKPSSIKSWFRALIKIRKKYVENLYTGTVMISLLFHIHFAVIDFKRWWINIYRYFNLKSFLLHVLAFVKFILSLMLYKTNPSLCRALIYHSNTFRTSIHTIIIYPRIIL